MSLAKLPSELLQIIVSTGPLNVSDIASLRLVSRACNAAFTSIDFCRFCLSHFFPFAPETCGIGGGRTPMETFRMIQQRLYRLRRKQWAIQREFSFAPDTMSGDFFSPENLRIMDLDSDKGYYLTAEFDSASLHIIVKSLISGQQVYVTIPRDRLGGIYMNGGKVLLVYNREERNRGSSMFVLVDCREGGDGRTVWSASVNTSVFPGVGDLASKAADGKRRLQPLFNDHYIAFLNGLQGNGSSNIMILRFEEPSSTESTSEGLHILPLRISPQTLISIRPDNAGRHLLVAEKFPHHNNLHRIVLVNAYSGESLRAYHFNVSPLFSLVPERDMDMFFAPNQTEIIIYGSVRNREYRQGGIIGQVMVVKIWGNEGTKIRYLRAPADGIVPDIAQTKYCPELGLIWHDEGIVAFNSLNLLSTTAGSGEFLNSHNLCPILWTSMLPTPAEKTKKLCIGKSWICTEFTGPSFGCVEICRIAEPRLPASQYGQGSSLRSSLRSSWILETTTSENGSFIGFGMTEEPPGALQVDAGELTARLREELEKLKVGGEEKNIRAGAVKSGWRQRISWEGKKSWKERLFSRK
ncbi:hypothetical protein L873DRAFT_1809502 [Choiromyces venosus 120613-1]|uniref:F-box domain-containing protein n=1 Tax=Choiromyces venosus 120613-1 TaxID=1336337 RepID=A0A3N4JL24_9PEZI|nr:hypothetical protein L873DRAFT_1809502 [Choiromyces venosus 120613-1]